MDQMYRMLEEAEAKTIADIEKLKQDLQTLEKNEIKLAQSQKEADMEFSKLTTEMTELLAGSWTSECDREGRIDSEIFLTKREESLAACEFATAVNSKRINTKRIELENKIYEDIKNMKAAREQDKADFTKWKKEHEFLQNEDVLPDLQTFVSYIKEKNIKICAALKKASVEENNGADGPVQQMPRTTGGLLKDAPGFLELPGFRTEAVTVMLDDILLLFGNNVRFEFQYGDYVTTISTSNLLDCPVMVETNPPIVIGAGCGASPAESFEVAVNQAYDGLFHRN